MKLSLHPIAALGVVAALLFPLKVNAQFAFASDNSTNSAYGDGWATGDNGGAGFASWTLASGGGTGGFGGDFIEHWSRDEPWCDGHDTDTERRKFASCRQRHADNRTL